MDRSIGDDIRKAVDFPLKELILKQEIVHAQMSEASTGYSKCRLNDSGLKNLQYMDLVYQASRDIKEFSGDIKEWEEYIETTIKKT